MRIGELAGRVGVSTHVLRAWESRYGLLTPVRSPGGYRLYGSDDERRVREVVSLRDQGVSAMEACRQVLAAERAGDAATGGEGDGAHAARESRRDTDPMRTDPPVLVAQLLDAVTALDEDRAHAVLDTAFLDRSVESAIVEVVVPFFARVGEMWELGRIGVAQEHFASSLVRRRLGALSLTWGIGTGPVAVLACPPGEFHDIILLSFGVLLGRAGWRIRYLGPDTPIASLSSAADLIEPDAVVLAARRPAGFRAHGPTLGRIAQRHPLWLAGRGTTPRVLDEIAAHHLGPDLVASVSELTEAARERRRGLQRAPSTGPSDSEPRP
ncbi:HTH-type transcriptional repressor CarH [Phycicoccus endophyticus]|nr:HTH-type transcriptional repressor CarH [Phycicoccus endophyticus]